MRIAALNTLGRMSSFPRWHVFVSQLTSDDAQVRRAAVSNLSRKAGGRAYRYLIPLLDSEQHDDILRQIIGTLALRPTKELCIELIRIASAHPSQDIQHAADWVLEEIDAELLGKALLAVLKNASEDTIVFVVEKMGRRRLPGCREVIAAYVRKEDRPRVRIAALEALGYLGDTRYLAEIAAFIHSVDPMEAYMATVSACQVAPFIDECPQLMDILRSSDENQVVLKQVVLQFLADTNRFRLENGELFTIARDNLSEENINVRYYSVMLLGRMGRRDVIVRLSAVALADDEPNVRATARGALDEVQHGDNSFLLDQLGRGAFPDTTTHEVYNTLAGFSWNLESARQAIDVLAAHFEDDNDEQLAPVLIRIARKVFALDPEGIRQYFEKHRTPNIWRLCLSEAWLESMENLMSRQERRDWRRLFQDEDPRIASKALDAAVRARMEWTIDPMLERLYRYREDSLSSGIRGAVTTVLGL